MSNEHDNKANEQPNETPKVPIPSVDNNTNKVVGEGKEANSQQGDSCENPIYTKECKPKGWSIAERVAATAIVLNFVAILFTCNSVSQSIKIAGITDSTFQLTKKRDAMAIKQIQDLNRPLLQISVDNFKVAIPGQKMVIIFSLKNLGEYAAKVTDGKFWIICESGTVNNPFDPVNNVNKSKGVANLINTYVIKESKESKQFVSDEILTQENFTLIGQQKKFIFFFGEVNYINEFTQEPAVYRFNIKFLGPDLSSSILLHNENAPK